MANPTMLGYIGIGLMGRPMVLRVQGRAAQDPAVLVELLSGKVWDSDAQGPRPTRRPARRRSPRPRA